MAKNKMLSLAKINNESQKESQKFVGAQPWEIPCKHRQPGGLVTPPACNNYRERYRHTQGMLASSAWKSICWSLSEHYELNLHPPLPQLIDHRLPHRSGAICLQLRGNGFLANRVGPGRERVFSVWRACMLTVTDRTEQYFCLALAAVSLTRDRMH